MNISYQIPSIETLFQRVELLRVYGADNYNWILFCIGMCSLLYSVIVWFTCGKWKKKYMMESKKYSVVVEEKEQMQKMLDASEKLVMVFREEVDARKAYYSAKDHKCITRLRRKLVDQAVLFARTQKRVKVLEQVIESNKESLNRIHDVDYIVGEIRKILNDPRYNMDDQLLYTNDDEWTLAQLKCRAKELGITCLHNYKYVDRRALAIVIRAREQLEAISCLIGSGERSCGELRSDDESEFSNST